MTTATDTESVKEALDTANPNWIADAERAALLGQAMGLITRSAVVVITAGVATLPNDAKMPYTGAVSVFVTAGTTKGNYTFKGVNTAPTTGTYTVTPDGNMLFDAADDAPTEAEIVYHPVEGLVFTDTIAVVSHVATLLGGRSAQVLISCVNQAGTAKTCDTTRGGSPSNGHVAINAAGTGIANNASDTSTSLTVVYVAFPGNGNAQDSLYDRLAADFPITAP